MHIIAQGVFYRAIVGHRVYPFSMVQFAMIPIRCQSELGLFIVRDKTGAFAHYAVPLLEPLYVGSRYAPLPTLSFVVSYRAHCDDAH